jgi:hypothetical protein
MAASIPDDMESKFTIWQLELHIDIVALRTREGIHCWWYVHVCVCMCIYICVCLIGAYRLPMVDLSSFLVESLGTKALFTCDKRPQWPNPIPIDVSEKGNNYFRYVRLSAVWCVWR